MYSYEMKHHPTESPATASRKFPEREHAKVYGELTRENLRKFEQQQEQRAAVERKLKQQEGAASQQSRPVSSLGKEPQHYVLDRVVEVDVTNEEEKYLCCCRCTNAYRGAWFVGLTQALICLVAAIVVIVNYSRLGRNYLDHFAAVICICVCYIIVLAFHFCGLQGKTACMLIPNLIAQLITMILFIVTAIILSVKLTATDQSDLVIWAGWGPLYGDLAKEAGLSLFTVALTLISVCAMALLLYMWFFHITVKCYRYLNDLKRKHRGLVYNETGKVLSSASTPISK